MHYVLYFLWVFTSIGLNSVALCIDQFKPLEIEVQTWNKLNQTHESFWRHNAVTVAQKKLLKKQGKKNKKTSII